MGTDLKSVSLSSIRETDSEIGKCSMHTDERELNHKICVVGAGEPLTGLTTYTLSYIPGNRKKAHAFWKHCGRSPKSHPLLWPSASSLDIPIAPCTLVMLSHLWFLQLLKRFQALVHLTESNQPYWLLGKVHNLV